LKIGSLFAGVGGLELGLERAGLGVVVWQVEVDSFCRAVLENHYPYAKRFGDVCSVGKHNLEPVDVLCGGFPCQDVSVAGKGAGLAGERSGLWCEFARVVSELRPRWVVVENVSQGAKRWVDPVVRDLEQLGYATLLVPLEACAVGAPHERARLFIVAANAVEDDLRHFEQWPSAGRNARGVRDSGEALSLYTMARRGIAPDLGRRSPPTPSRGGTLHPSFVEWMMGFPLNWTKLEMVPLEMLSSRSARKSSAGSSASLKKRANGVKHHA
jgi:DNA-cytosine methyltransferase